MNKNKSILFWTINYIKMPVQTRSQTRIANANVNTDKYSINNATVEIHASNKLYSSYPNREHLPVIKDFLKKTDESGYKVEKKMVVLQMYHYLCSSHCVGFLQRNTKFTIKAIQKLIELKNANDFLEWEAEYFLSKLKNIQTDDIRIAWDAVCNNTPIIWIKDD